MRARISLLGPAMLLTACAAHGPVVTGKFGESPVPDAWQTARLYLDSGDSVTARKIEQERDSLYVTRMDYSVAAFAADRVERIRIQDREEPEAGSSEHAGLKPESAQGDNRKVGESIMRGITIVTTAVAAVLLIVFLL